MFQGSNPGPIADLVQCGAGGRANAGSNAPFFSPPTHPVSARALLNPKKHPLERTKPCEPNV